MVVAGPVAVVLEAGVVLLAEQLVAGLRPWPAVAA